MEATINEKDYRELLEKIGEEKFRERFSELVKTAKKFIGEAGYEEDVECNERIMLSVMLDYYSDIERLKQFHQIEHVRTEKIFAYLIAWIVRRKPLQFMRHHQFV